MNPRLPLFLTMAILAGHLNIFADSWNQFRGPNGSGVARESRPPTMISPDHPTWQSPVPPGLSSPVVAGNRVFLTALEDGRLVTLAIDASTGKPLWRREAPTTTLENVHRTSSPAASTPLVDAERIFVYFGSYGLLCYDHTGRVLWAKPMPTPESSYGMATSPIAYKQTVILVLDDNAELPDSELRQSRMLAVRKSNGDTVWETPRPLHRSGWSTPMIWSHAEGQDLVVLGSGRVAGYDPQTGEEKWFATGFSRETIAVPVAGNGHLYAAAAMLGGVPDKHPDPQPFWEAVLQFDANQDDRLERPEMTEHFAFPLRPELPPGHPGYGVPLPEDEDRRQGSYDRMFSRIDKDHDGYWSRDEFLASMSFRRGKPLLMAIRPGGTGNVTETHVSWELNRNIPEIPSPVFHQDRIYLVRNGGMLAAVDAGDGTVLYRERLGASGQYSASPVVADGRLYLVSNKGMLSVVKPGAPFKILYQQDLGEPAFTTPAFDASTIYIRTATRLWAFRREEP